MKQKFYQLPKDYTGPPHLSTWKVLSCTLLSVLLLSASFSLPWLSWFALAPFFTSLIGRKDQAVFTYGFLFGLCFWGAQVPSSQGYILIIPLALSCGLWLWLIRKFYYFLCFPKADSSVATAKRQQFILPWYKLLLLSLCAAIIWTFLEWLNLRIFKINWHFIGLTQVRSDLLLPIVQIAGPLLLSFLVIMINFSIASAIETKLLDIKTKTVWLQIVPCLSLTILVYFLPQVLQTNYKGGKIIKVERVDDDDIRIQVNDQNFDSSNKLVKIDDNTIASSTFDDLQFSHHVFSKVRNGANCIIVLSKVRLTTNNRTVCVLRSSESGIPIVIVSQNDIYKFSPLATSPAHSKNQASVTIFSHSFPPFYYHHPLLFCSIIGFATFFILLLNGIHFLRRKKRLKDLLIC